MEDMNDVLEEISETIKKYEDMGEMLLNKNELAHAYAIRGALHTELNMQDEAVVDFDRSIEIMEKMYGKGSHPDENFLAQAYATRGGMYFTKGDVSIAISDFNKSIEIWEHLQSKGMPINEELKAEILGIRDTMYIYDTTGENMDDAITHYLKTIEYAENCINTGQPFDKQELVDAYFNTAFAYGYNENFDESNKYYGKCLALLKNKSDAYAKLDNKTLKDLSKTYMCRGENYYTMEKYDEALSDFNECVSIEEHLQKNGEEIDIFDAGDISRAYANRARTLAIKGEQKQVVNDYSTALQILKKVFSIVPEKQEIYYDYLNELIKFISEKSNAKLLDNIFNEFLHSMHSLPKTEEAEALENDILRQWV
jgi:tetratricopeptide (TPR) repeat protein